MSSTSTKTVKERVEAIEGKKDDLTPEQKNIYSELIKYIETNTYTNFKSYKEGLNKIAKKLASSLNVDVIGKNNKVNSDKLLNFLRELSQKQQNEILKNAIKGLEVRRQQEKESKSKAGQQTQEKLAKKIEQATDKQETKEETKIIKEDIKEGMMEGKTAKQLTQEIVSDISYTKEDEKKVEQVIKKAMETQTEEKPKLTMEASGGTSQTSTKPKLTMEASSGTSQTSTKPKLTMEKTGSVSQRDVAGAFRGRSNYESIGAVLPVPRKQTKKMETQTESKQRTMETQTESEQRTGGTQTEEPIVDSRGSNFSESKIEISKVAETEQIRRQEEMPMDFSVGGISGQRLKEGKTTLKQLQDEMPQPIQKPAQLLQWINKVGGYENYVYLRSKFGLTEDIQGSMEYLQEIEKCLVNLYGGDLGVGMANYSNELQLKQCIRELNIMKNCLYISKFKASVGPQYGLVIGLNKVMSLADMLGKAPPMPQSSQEQPPQMTPNKPVVKGQERIEYEDEKAQLVQGLPQQPQRGRRLNVANPEISPDIIQESNLERGRKSEKIAPSRSIHEMVMQGQTPTQQQAMTISRGIKLMKPRKQF